jgi:hypothetical protein
MTSYPALAAWSSGDDETGVVRCEINSRQGIGRVAFNI